MSENVFGADNQQERLELKGWIVGFVDGEGAFTVSILRNSTARLGWQVFPEFIVTQGAKSKNVLDIFQDFFNCGKVYINKRYDNHRQDLYRYCVRSIVDLQTKVIPFFKENTLKTYKRKDFEKFCEILELIKQKKHLTISGVDQIAHITMQMNRKIKPKFLESSQTIRQT